MGIMSFLRNRMGLIVVIVIGLALFAFVASEAVQYGRSFFAGDRTTVGEIAGEKLQYDDFNTKLDQNTKQYQQQFGGTLNSQMTSYVQNFTWNQYVSQIIFKKEVDKLGIVVGDDETNKMIHGGDPEIARNFANQQTGQLDRNQLNQFLTSLQSAPANDPMKAQWASYVATRIEAKKVEKYLNLVRNGLYVNSLEAKDDYEAKNKLANFKYVGLDYASIPDNKVTLTDADYQSYYDEHKSQFKNPEETRSFQYVAFNAAPSKEDSAEVKKQADKLAADFKASNNDSLFVQINAVDNANKAPLVYQHKGQLDPKLDSVMFTAPKGFVYGPYLSNGSYKVSKLIDERVGPDSVKARHILISPQTEGSMAKAQAKADSIKKLIAGGKSFADLAKMYSIDKGSAEKGGELGTFGRGAMVPAFEEAAFNGKKGDLLTVESQYGVHIIQVEDQKGSSKVVKVATIDRPLQASSTTQSAAFSKAQSFLSGANGNNFAAEAKKMGLEVKTANDVNGLAAALPGLDNARELVKWAFNAEKGDIADKAFTAGDVYVVPRLTEIKPKGELSLEAVKTLITPAVRNQVKAKQLAEKLQGSTIDQVAQKAGSKVVPVQNIVFANPVLPGIAQENKLIGAIFGSKPNKLSKPIDGDHGVYVYVVDSFVNPAPLTNAVREREQIGQAMLQRADNQIFDALKDKANVKDYRAKFL
ncbi:SurA N-terminal domain-containing protein [Mucilaginibacter sp. KACC 22063]|nr:peptidylprolyl isomerase [Mucilaginibacter sp. KACC 22063]WDF55081.1 SurA N-terminal domain-containing protein [Mucilaginibacter sp. KACC 22063]